MNESGKKECYLPDLHKKAGIKLIPAVSFVPRVWQGPTSSYGRRAGVTSRNKLGALSRAI